MSHLAVRVLDSQSKLLPHTAADSSFAVVSIYCQTGVTIYWLISAAARGLVFFVLTVVCYEVSIEQFCHKNCIDMFATSLFYCILSCYIIFYTHSYTLHFYSIDTLHRFYMSEFYSIHVQSMILFSSIVVYSKSIIFNIFHTCSEANRFLFYCGMNSEYTRLCSVYILLCSVLFNSNHLTFFHLAFGFLTNKEGN